MALLHALCNNGDKIEGGRGYVKDSFLDKYVSRFQNATAMGANAIVMMRFDSAEIGQTMSEIVAYGTAVVLEPGESA